MTTRQQHLASLYVLRWASYSRSPHIMSKGEQNACASLLARKKAQWAKDGRMPIPDDQEPVSLVHIITSGLGDLTVHDPRPQDAWLTIEKLGTMRGFAHWKQLAGWSRMPYAWFGSGPENMKEAREECGRFLAYLSEVLGAAVDWTAMETDVPEATLGRLA